MDEAAGKIGTVLEQLAARFELVVEAVTGFGGRFDALREEISGQFAEVGKQIRFLSDQIGENRQGLKNLHADLGAEIVRLGEALGATRVEFRQQLGDTRDSLKHEITQQTGQLRAEQSHLQSANAPAATSSRRDQVSTRDLKEQIVAATETVTRKLDADLKQANKLLAGLSRKLDHFDDRITIQTKDHDQRLKKLERRTSQG